MKTLQTIRSKKIGVIAGFVLAMLLVVSSFLALQNDPGRLTAAAVVERGNQQTETVEADAMDDNAAATDSAAVRDGAIATETPATRKAPPTVVENRMTEEAREAAETVRSLGTGEASFYGAGFAGRPTANGERFDPSEMTAAHRTLPFGSKLRVTNTANGKSVVVRVNDRGPYAHNRVIDLSRGAAERIGMIHSGTADVKIDLIS